jgi:hypothetical protein
MKNVINNISSMRKEVDLTRRDERETLYKGARGEATKNDRQA